MAEATMRAVVMDGFGGPEVLRLGEAPRPRPGPGQVLIRVAATSVNRADLQQRAGNYPPPPGESEILGLEVAGVIEELGEGVSGWRAGDRVMTLVGGGGYAEYATAPASTLMPVPDGIDLIQAAAISRGLDHRLSQRVPRGRACSPARPCSCTAAPRASAPRRSSSPRRSAPRP